ncbi:MAG: uncharacterized protein A8A55_0455 [Amphiamblys sp. WSBS2006]|nr:MAG: uncharacterized protein A8A55_0455 [Amphiamblys sp. WSBS2006]
MITFGKTDHEEFTVAGAESDVLVLEKRPSQETKEKVFSKMKETPVKFKGFYEGDLLRLVNTLGGEFKAQLEETKRILLFDTAFEDAFRFSDDVEVQIDQPPFEKDLIENILLKNSPKIKKLVICGTLMPGYFKPATLSALKKCCLRGKGTLSFFLRTIGLFSKSIEELEVTDNSDTALLMADMKIVRHCVFPKIKKIRLDGIGVGKLFAQILKTPSRSLASIEVRDMSAAGLHYKEETSRSCLRLPCLWCMQLSQCMDASCFMWKQSGVNPSPRKIKRLVLVGNGSARFFSFFSKHCPHINTLVVCEPLGFKEKMFGGKFTQIRSVALFGDFADENVFREKLTDYCEKKFVETWSLEDEQLDKTDLSEVELES